MKAISIIFKNKQIYIYIYIYIYLQENQKCETACVHDLAGKN